MDEVSGRLGAGFQGFLSCAVTQDVFNSLSMGCDNTCEMLPTRGIHRVCAQGFHLGLASLCLLGAKIPDSWNVDVRPEIQRLYKQAQ